jgi:hypothetical protein
VCSAARHAARAEATGIHLHKKKRAQHIAFSGEVGTGSPKKKREAKQKEHNPFQFERIMLLRLRPFSIQNMRR